MHLPFGVAVVTWKSFVARVPHAAHSATVAPECPNSVGRCNPSAVTYRPISRALVSPWRRVKQKFFLCTPAQCCVGFSIGVCSLAVK